MIIKLISYFVAIAGFIVSIVSMQISKNLCRNQYVHFDYNVHIYNWYQWNKIRLAFSSDLEACRQKILSLDGFRNWSAKIIFFKVFLVIWLARFQRVKALSVWAWADRKGHVCGAHNEQWKHGSKRWTERNKPSFCIKLWF